MNNFRYIIGKLIIPVFIILLGSLVLISGIQNNQNIFFLLGGAGLVVAGLITGLFMLSYERIPKLVFTILLILFIPTIALYFVFNFNSINDPISFENEYNKRSEVVKERLLNISEVQVAYRSVYGQYTGSFDTLINFITEGNLVLIQRVNKTPKGLEDEFTEEQLINKGYITFDTLYKNVKDSLFKDNPDFNPENIKYIPFSNPKRVIEMEATKIDRSNVKMPVFVAKAPKIYYLHGLDEEYIKRDDIIDLQVGSLTEPIRDGNW